MNIKHRGLYFKPYREDQNRTVGRRRDTPGCRNPQPKQNK